jgi:hypothetical protein
LKVSANTTLRELLRAVPKRLVELVVKLASAKGLVFVLATAVWLGTDRMDFWQWLACAGLLVGSRTIEKLKGGPT